MKRIGLTIAAIVYLAGLALWAKHADLPLQSGAAIEASATQNTLEVNGINGTSTGQLAYQVSGNYD